MVVWGLFCEFVMVGFNIVARLTCLLRVDLRGAVISLVCGRMLFVVLVLL